MAVEDWQIILDREVIEMRKVISLLMVTALCISLAACGGNKKAFSISKSAYENIEIAYDITEQFGSDLYEAWRLGIYNEDDILDDGVSFLASELSLSEEELSQGIAYVVADMVGEDWNTIPEDTKTALVESADSLIEIMKDELFSFCALAVSGAYATNGEAEKAQDASLEAKANMKELSEAYSDYEHYPNLKGYYTTTSAYFEFCQNPTGSFEQVKDTINKYKNEARDYKNDLDFIFEE